MKTVFVKKSAKWWYAIVREEGSTKNLTMASFSTKRAATEAAETWAKTWGYKVIK